jgi:hypothetical protein
VPLPPRHTNTGSRLGLQRARAAERFLQRQRRGDGDVRCDAGALPILARIGVDRPPDREEYDEAGADRLEPAEMVGARGGLTDLYRALGVPECEREMLGRRGVRPEVR